jgi:CRP/FNR family cyclic AMP-dependent transcriptional regulator
MTGTTLFRNTQEYQEYQASNTIFKEGDSAEEMYVVIQGQVDILIHGEVIDTIGPDSILGELALIDDHIRSATAVAKTDCKLVPINKKRFAFLVSETPFFALDVMKVMADRLRRRTA